MSEKEDFESSLSESPSGSSPSSVVQDSVGLLTAAAVDSESKLEDNASTYCGGEDDEEEEDCRIFSPSFVSASEEE